LSDLNQAVATATRWSLINTMVLRIGSFAAGVILARFFLSPREFGLYAVGLVVVNVMLSLNELGVSLALVRWNLELPRFAPTVLTLSTVSSSALYVVLFAAAPSVAAMLGSPDATTLLRVLCLTVVIDGIACVPIARLTREFKQMRRMIVDLANFAVTNGVTIALAATGSGAMSFAWGALAGNLVALIGFAIASPGMLRFGWDPAMARKLVRFGVPLAGASLLTLGILNVDSAVVGAVLGPVALGFYQLALNMSNWPVRVVSETARRVTFAGFSRLADSPAELAAGFYRALSIIMAAAMPICTVLAWLAEPVIVLVYGPKWAPAATALRFLVILGVLRVAYELAYDCLATSRRRALMAVQGWWLLTLVPTLLVMAHMAGIAGVAAGHVLVPLLLVLPAFLIALAPLGIRPGGILLACWRPLVGAGLMSAVLWTTLELAGRGLGAAVLAGFLSVLVYGPVVLPVLRGIRRPAALPDPAAKTPTPAELSGEPLQ